MLPANQRLQRTKEARFTVRSTAPAPLSRQSLARLGAVWVLGSPKASLSRWHFSSAVAPLPFYMRPFLITQGLTLARRIPVGKGFQDAALTRSFSGPHTLAGSRGGAADLHGVRPRDEVSA